MYNFGEVNKCIMRNGNLAMVVVLAITASTMSEILVNIE